jgi:hypothetical protein
MLVIFVQRVLDRRLCRNNKSNCTYLSITHIIQDISLINMSQSISQIIIAVPILLWLILSSLI